MVLLLACAQPDLDPDPATGDTVAAALDQPLGVERDPIGVVSVTACATAPNGCGCNELGAWGLYDRVAPRVTFGTEWEHWGPEPVWDGECAAISTVASTWCDPACADGELCTGDGTCEPWPEHLSAGPITLGGLTTPITLEPQDIGGYAFTVEAPEELYADDVVTLDAPGDELGAFSVRGRVPATLDADLDCGTLLTADGDVVLTWTPGDPRDRVRLYTTSISHGGGGGAETMCEGPDDGELVIPASMLGVSSSSWGFDAVLTRFTRASAPLGAGEVRLELGSARMCGLVTQGCG